MGFVKKACGYIIRKYDTDHPPLHVHVYRDGRLVARFDLEGQMFMDVDPRHRRRVMKALRQCGLAR